MFFDTLTNIKKQIFRGVGIFKWGYCMKNFTIHFPINVIYDDGD